MASKRKQQQIDAMVKRLQDLAYAHHGDCWGNEEFPLTIEAFNAVSDNVRWRFGLNNVEPDTDLWRLFNSCHWLHEWTDPKRVAEILIENGVKP